MSLRLLPLLALSAFAAGPLFAQTSPERSYDAADADFRRRLEAQRGGDSVKSPETSVPTLYEGELEDVGPQMLLLESPPHRWFFADADLPVVGPEHDGGRGLSRGGGRPVAGAVVQVAGGRGLAPRAAPVRV